MQNRIPVTLKVGSSSFSFTISHKCQRLGDLSINQLWMPRATLYEPETHENSIQLVECFWDLCLQAYSQGESEHPDDRQTYLLARLCPFSFSHLSRGVMPDAAFQSSDGPKEFWRDSVRILRERLRKTPQPEDLGLVKFRNLTYGIYGMPELSSEEEKLYDQICADLLTEPAKLMDKNNEQAVEALRQRWDNLKRQHYSRRRWVSPEAKSVFTVLSYECRAAFHECYSDTWIELLRQNGPLAAGPHDPHWPKDLDLTAKDLCLMTLWNVVLKCPSNLPNAPFQPLHGQLLGLHPASALLIATPRGQRILGDLVSALLANGDIPKPQDILQTISKMPQFNDLSHALVFAAEVYMERRDELRQQRRSRGSRNIEDLERRGKIVAHRTVPRRSRADRQASATNARISKKKIQRAFKQYAKEKNFTCPGNEGCELAYLNHEKIADSDSVSDQVRVTYQCRRHHKKFDVAVSEDELSQVLSELGGGDHSA